MTGDYIILGIFAVLVLWAVGNIIHTFIKSQRQS